MRLRNVKNKNEIMQASKILIEDREKYRGNWNCVFEEKHPIYLEIGMGKGKFLVTMAKKYPEINFIGIEKYDSVIVRALEKVEYLPNLRMIRMNANEIDTVFDHEISRIYLNFSDPWPKVRHHDRRLTSFFFLQKYDTIFQAHGEIYQKTDHRDLFEYSLVSLSSYGYHFEKVSLDCIPEETDSATTEYEDRFLEQKVPIYFLIAKK